MRGRRAGAECDVERVRACVCSFDATCCDDGTALCVLRAVVDCGIDLYEPPSNDCCEPAKIGEAGCDDFESTHCVCTEFLPECGMETSRMCGSTCL